MAATGDIPEFWTYLQQSVDVAVIGHAESWTAPVARFVAPSGFGESVWIDAIPDSVIAVRLGGSQVSKARGVCAGRSSIGTQGFALQPRGGDNHYSASGACTFAQILLTDSLLDRASAIAGQPRLSGRLRPDLVFAPLRDLEQTAHAYVRRALDPRAPPTALEMEGLTLVLLDRLLARHGDGRPQVIRRGGLPPRQLQRVTAYMQDHLADDLLLEDLAGLVGISARHFARAFKHSTGLPPHRWMINQRIERARDLLARGDLAIADIALLCGFADQSHFTTTFRSATGVTPAVFRRQVIL